MGRMEIMRTGFTEEAWWQNQWAVMTAAITEAMDFQKQVAEMERFYEEGFFHPTRVWEYPWALEQCPPVGAILDVGSNPQWQVTLLGMGHEVMAHNTAIDTQQVGMVNCWARGWHSLKECYEKYENEASLVLGPLDRLPLIGKSFDTIYCLSTIEHVEPWNLDAWLEAMVGLLAPGGRLCLTVDYALDFKVGEGKQPFLWNHDLTVLQGMGLTLEVGVLEMPLALPDDAILTPWDPVGPFAVYGAVLRK